MAIIDIKSIPQRYQRYYTYLEPVLADPLVRGYFGLVASFLLVAFFLIFALSPTIDTILTLRKKIADQKTTIAALDTKINNLISARQNYSQVENLIPVLEIALPPGPSPQTAISGMVSAASSSATVIDGISFGSATMIGDIAAVPPADTTLVPAKVSVLPFSLSVNGSREAVLAYFQKLENSLRYIRFLTLSFSSGVKTTVDASGLTYYYVGKQ